MSAVLPNLDGMRIIVMFRIVLRWMKNAVVVKLGSRFGILMVSLPHLLMIIGALERFNRELNHAFPNAHPSMPEFVTTIRRISADKYTRVARGREQGPVHQPANLFTVPAAYYTFAYVAPTL